MLLLLLRLLLLLLLNVADNDCGNVNGRIPDNPDGCCCCCDNVAVVVDGVVEPLVVVIGIVVVVNKSLKGNTKDRNEKLRWVWIYVNNSV